MYISGV